MSGGERVEHPFSPLFCKSSRILILGSFPSVKSREENFFYGHPRNRFWRVIAALTGSPEPQNREEKERLILSNGLALWDVIGSCVVDKSSDASIREVKPNDLGAIFRSAPIERVYCNGSTSYAYYRRYDEAALGIEAALLPSTSPANAAWSLQRLIEAWRVIFD